MESFEGKVAIVTGGAGASAGASGSSCARKLAELGAKVVVADINREGGAELEAELREAGYDAAFIPFDLTDEESIKALVSKAVERYGKIDVLVNLGFANINEPNVDLTSTKDFDFLMSVNFRGHFLVSREALPHLTQQTTSAIVNVASISALRGELGYAIYGAAKAALISLTRSIAAQYGRQGVRCNAVVPGLIPFRREPSRFRPESRDQGRIRRYGEADSGYMQRDRQRRRQRRVLLG